MQTTIADVIKIKGHRVYSVSPDASLLETLRTMAEHQIGAVLVLEADNSLAGVFSERDYARQSVKRENLPMTTPIRELMTVNVISVRPEQTVMECMESVTLRRIRHLPVVGDGGLLGVVSIGDLVKAAIAEQEALIEEKESLIRQLEGYISGTAS